MFRCRFRFPEPVPKCAGVRRESAAFSGGAKGRNYPWLLFLFIRYWKPARAFMERSFLPTDNGWHRRQQDEKDLPGRRRRGKPVRFSGGSWGQEGNIIAALSGTGPLSRIPRRVGCPSQSRTLLRERKLTGGRRSYRATRRCCSLPTAG